MAQQTSPAVIATLLNRAPFLRATSLAVSMVGDVQRNQIRLLHLRGRIFA